MNYYEVIPASNTYHGKEPLTYHYEKKLDPGRIIRINMRGSQSLGIVTKSAPKPGFKTTPIKDVLDFSLPDKQLGLIEWISKYYPAPLGSIALLFVPSFVEKLKPFEPSDKFQGGKGSLPKLTREQSAAYGSINTKAEEGQRSFILHGITGSGKTRLYMELSKDSLKKGKSVVILTPEISLTAPIAKQFEDIFGNRVIVNHSSLTQKQRAGIWSRLFSEAEPLIIVGPRSSLFMPIDNIGLIVVDEFHESAYKQESQPFYHANRVASVLSRLYSAKLIFGSATPPVIDYFQAEQKNVPIVKMVKSAMTGKKPSSSVVPVNLLDQEQKSSYPLISNALIAHLNEVLKKGEQAMVFINKRGSARSISCQDCGHRELCENCDLPMVYHGDQHLIRCHTCGAHRTPPNKCPECGSTDIVFSSPGTKAIAENLSKIFPQAKIVRFDKDNKKSDRMENRYDEMSDEADIIVGTQIIAKGHDLPRLSLVAMLLADNGLDFPDYTSTERSYQLIKQLSGRVNRGHRDGTFIIQTFNPASKFIKSAIQGDWDDFYQDEIKQRRTHGFPPFYSALKVEVSRKTSSAAQKSLEDLIKKIDKNDIKLVILGPSPGFVEKKSSNWHWQIILMSKSRSDLLEISKLIPGSFKLDMDPNNFL